MYFNLWFIFFAWVQVRMQGKQMIAVFAAEGTGQS
jgi:hypothetical protein